MEFVRGSFIDLHADVSVAAWVEKTAPQYNSLIILAQLSGFVCECLFGRNHTLDKPYVNNFRIFVQFLMCTVVSAWLGIWGKKRTTGAQLKQNLPK